MKFKVKEGRHLILPNLTNCLLLGKACCFDILIYAGYYYLEDEATDLCTLFFLIASMS